MVSWLEQLTGRAINVAASSGADAETANSVWIGIDELIQLGLKARGIRLESRRQVAYAQAGGQLSRVRGRGIDYQESRAYQPGDDIRHMDWRVTARTSRPHTKLYREERERPVIVMVDLNPSMFFGTQGAFKSVAAARVAALIGWAAVHQGDRVGGFLFGCHGHEELAATGGRRGILRLIRALSAWTSPTEGFPYDGRAQGLGAALQRLRRVARPGSLVYILSDFYALDQDSERHLSRLRQHNDVVACQIADSVELKAPPPGRYAITDGLQTRVLDTRSTLARDRYDLYCASRQQRVQNLMHKYSVPVLILASHDDIPERLRKGVLNPGGKAAKAWTL